MRAVLVLFVAIGCGTPPSHPLSSSPPPALAIGYLDAERADAHHLDLDYHHAASLAANDPAAARIAFEELLARDLPYYGARLDADPALAGFRAGPEGVHLHHSIAAIETAYAAAIADGTPMLLFSGTRGSQNILTPTVMRPGVWLATSRRLVPLAPPMPHAMAGFVDVDNKRVVQVGLDVSDCRSDFCPRIPRVAVEVWSLAPRPVELVSWSRESGEQHGIVVQSAATGVRVQVDDCNEAMCKTPWAILDARGAHDDVFQGRATARTLEVDHRGASLTVPAAGVAFDASDLAPRCVGADATHTLVALTSDRCDCQSGDGAVFTHAIERVDRASGQRDVIHAGKGASAAAFAPDGAVYVQLNDRVMRFTSIATVTSRSDDALPADILVEPPLAPRYCCGL